MKWGIDLTNQHYSDITENIQHYAKKCTDNFGIDPTLYTELQVKRGLRDLDGRGVLTGLTEISEINAYKNIDGKLVPCEGELYYRGIPIRDLVHGFTAEGRMGFEETVYLLLFGSLPNSEELADFRELLSSYRSMPTNFVRDVILKAPTPDLMNTLARSVLTLYGYDKNPADISIPNALRQCLQLIATMPLMAVYSYHSYRHYIAGDTLYIRRPDPNLSTAENILRLLRPDGKYTPLEAELLDVALVLHAEHGGGNNSTFTTHVVTSSGTDTYSSMAASLCSLKGPRHGGANIKVVEMFNDIRANVKDWSDEEELRIYLEKIVNKEAFDRSGLIYGMGHAVYSLSDPRSDILREYVEELSHEKGKEKEFELYNNVARLAPEIIAGKRKVYKGVSPNVDFYSGFVYSMLDLPSELYTPLFAIGRIAGWSAHRLEELIGGGKIIRPAYENVNTRFPYVPLNKRK